MPTLKEIKGRISSVRSTLKITSAMKLVSSAKLRKAQNAIAAMRPYQEALEGMMSKVAAGYSDGVFCHSERSEESISRKALIAIASNSSLCGGFNANVISLVRSIRKEGDIVYSIGRKMAEAMTKDGFPSPADFSSLAEHPAYAPAAQLVEQLSQDLEAGRIGSVTIVYTHFVSTAKQVPVSEVLMVSDHIVEGEDSIPSAIEKADAPGTESSPSDVLIEPSKAELRATLIPKTLKLKLFAALLDSAAAEHAARTIAMQTATDNGNQLLDELTLQYNKGRQQKITNEILDLAGGQAAQ